MYILKGITVIVMNIKMMVCILLAVVCPALITSIVRFKKNKDLKKILKEILGVSLFSCLVVGACWIILKNKWTKYEFLYIDVMISCILSMVILPIFNKEKFNHIQALKTLAVCSVVTAAYSILTYGQANIHSDIATATLLAKSQIDHGTLFPNTWNYANGDIWVVATNLLVMPFYLLMENQPLARMIASVIWMLITAIAIVFYSKRIYKSDSWVITIPIIVIFMGQSCGQADCVLYQAAYICVLFWILICNMLFCEILEKPQKKSYYFLYGIIMVLIHMSGIRFLAEISIPILITCLIINYLETKNNAFVDLKIRCKNFLKQSVIVLAPATIGFLIYVFLLTICRANTGNEDQIQFVRWGDNIKIVFENLFGCFGYELEVSPFSISGFGNFILIFISLLIIIIVPYLQWKRIKFENKNVKYTFYYMVVHNVIMIIMVVFFNKISVRYLLTSVFLLVVTSSEYIYKYWIEQRSLEKYIWTVAFVISVLFMGGIMLFNSTGWNKKIAKQKEIDNIIIENGVSKAYAGYWDSYKNEIYSDMNIQFGAIQIYQNVIRPFYWLVDSDVYNIEDKKSVLLINKSDNKQFCENFEWLKNDAYDIIKFKDEYIYFFDYDLACVMDNGLDDNILMPGELFCTENVNKSGRRFEIEPTGIVFGPYIDMKKGTYTVTFNGDELENFECIVSSTNDKQNVINCMEVEHTENKIVLNVELEKDMDLVEFKIWNVDNVNKGYLYYINVQ